VKYWEIIADNLKKAGWKFGLRISYRRSRGERSGLLTLMAMESVSSFAPMKS